MSHDAEQLMNQALLLPPEERAALADRLLESLDSDEQREIDAAWVREARRRSAAVARGEMGTIPSGEALRMLKGRKP